jgi:hypothetical protein
VSDILNQIDSILAFERSLTHWRFEDTDTGEVIFMPLTEKDYGKYMKEGHRYSCTKVKLEPQREFRPAVYVADMLLEQEDGWIGVDLDGTLARYTGWKGATKIGKPIPRMVRRVRRWVSHGKKVKLFTARADDERSVNAIKKWLKDNELPDLEVTNLKDQDCIEFWDDRAKAVEKNTGRLKETRALIDAYVTADGHGTGAVIDDDGFQLPPELAKHLKTA